MAGSTLSFTENNRTSRMASQKSGTASIRLVPIVTARSAAEAGRVAASTPRGSPTTTVRARAPMAMLNVTGKRRAISPDTAVFLRRE